MDEMSTGYDFRGRTVVDREGDKSGKVDELYYDAEGAQPEWALVNTGLFGTEKTLVPLRGATTSGEDVQDHRIRRRHRTPTIATPNTTDPPRDRDRDRPSAPRRALPLRRRRRRSPRRRSRSTVRY